jgi:hypothetical protein
VTGFELADPERRVFAAGSEGGAALVCAGGEPVLAAAAGAALRAQGGEEGASGFELAAEGVSLRAELEPLGPAAVLEGGLVGSRHLSVCRALGELRGGPGETPVAALGVSVDHDGAARQDVLRRSINVVFGDGGLLALAAARPPDAGDHGDEEVVSVLAEPGGGQNRFHRTLLSTEYDAAGAHRRATIELELRGGGEPPMRGAGTLICGAAVALGQTEVRTAFFHWALEGRPGFGSYEIVLPR